MALLEAVEVQASHPTMILAEEGHPASKIEEKKVYFEMLFRQYEVH